MKVVYTVSALNAVLCAGNLSLWFVYHDPSNLIVGVLNGAVAVGLYGFSRSWA